MANSKPKKISKKSSDNKDLSKKTEETSVSNTSSTVDANASNDTKVMKGFFARKYDPNENILTIFKGPKIWGALIGEAIGTMLVVMLLLTLGVGQPLYLVLCLVGVLVAVVGLSGANLNPLITTGMMATRRMSAIRGVLYILAQIFGAWIGLIIVNAFRLGSQTEQTLPQMADVVGDTFIIVALIELMGAIILAFCFARALKYAKKSPLTFGFTVSGVMALVVILGIFIAQGFFSLDSSFIFNPAAALMYQILPTSAENAGELIQMVAFAIGAYVIVPMIGGIIGFYISDVTSRLACGGYFCDYDDQECAE